jgi:regulator of protease activity HflC (stomatin/prohibitin superfamily)
LITGLLFDRRQFPNPYKSVPQGSVGLISRFGQFYKSVDPGLVKVNVTSENLRMVDVKIQLSTVPKQAVMTKDNGTSGVSGSREREPMKQGD